ncbi:hypothetical protein L7F22_060991 [Adiantum nelumboides]|nr:hypothetical protein [Adiantum nelumboides]
MRQHGRNAFTKTITIILHVALMGGWSTEACNDGEREALLMFKEAGVDVDPGSRWLASWRRNATDCCQWRGVRCDSAAAVIGLLLNNCGGQDATDATVLQRLHEEGGMKGALIPQLLTAMGAGLPGLSRLDLGCHLFHGSIPPEIANLTSLAYLDLSFQGQAPPLTGPIPATLWSLPSLSHLDLGHNSLLGSLPEPISNSTLLTFLAVPANNLSDPLPASLANLSRLLHLDLSANAALTTLPSSWSRPSFNLHRLELYWCNFSTSHFPAWLSSQTNLSRLSLAGNHFSGPLPDWAWSLSSDFLDLSGNNFSGKLGCSSSIAPSPTLTFLDVSYNNHLSGTIPCHIANLSDLSFFSLAVNRLTGPIHPFIGNLTQLSFIDLSGNQLEGPIPSLQNMHSLTSLDFDTNLLSGSFPVSLLRLPLLERIDLSFNTLLGSLPDIEPPSNPALKYLKLSQNNLSGTLPPSLTRFTDLKILRLNGNNFTGSIPKGISALSKLLSFDMRENLLEGPLPLEMGNLSSLVLLSVSKNPRIKGAFPACVRSLSQLLAMDLRSINMEGEVPQWLGSSLQQLQILLLSGNRLSSRIPASLGSIKGMKNSGQKLSASAKVVKGLQSEIQLDDLVILTKGQSLDFRNLAFMAVLDLSRNKLQGAIPTELGQLRGLIALDVSSNLLEGGIPESLANLRALESLDLSDNMLEGGIPAHFSQMTALSFVDMSSNRLTGPIPSGGQWSTFHSSAFANNKGLCIDSNSASHAIDSTSSGQLPQCTVLSAGSQTSQPRAHASPAHILNEHVSWNGFAVGYPLGVLVFFLLKLAFKRRLHLVASFRSIRAKLVNACEHR